MIYRYKEIDFYDWLNPGNTKDAGKDIGHFTQV